MGFPLHGQNSNLAQSWAWTSFEVQWSGKKGTINCSQSVNQGNLRNLICPIKRIRFNCRFLVYISQHLENHWQWMVTNHSVSFCFPMEPETSRVWSCATLKDGIDYLLDEVSKVGEEEDLLEAMIKDSVEHVDNPSISQRCFPHRSQYT